MAITNKDFEHAMRKFTNTFKAEQGYSNYTISKYGSGFALLSISDKTGGEHKVLWAETRKQLFHNIHDVCDIAKRYKLKTK